MLKSYTHKALSYAAPAACEVFVGPESLLCIAASNQLSDMEFNELYEEDF